MSGVGVGAGVGKIWPTPTPVGVAGCHPSTDMILAERLSAVSKTLKDRKKENDSVDIKLKDNFLIEFGLKKSIGDNFRVIAVVVLLCQQI